MVCPKGKDVTLSLFGEAPVSFSGLGSVASPWGLFQVKGLLEEQGCDLSRFGEAPVSLR